MKLMNTIKSHKIVSLAIVLGVAGSASVGAVAYNYEPEAPQSVVIANVEPKVVEEAVEPVGEAVGAVEAVENVEVAAPVVVTEAPVEETVAKANPVGNRDETFSAAIAIVYQVMQEKRFHFGAAALTGFVMGNFDDRPDLYTEEALPQTVHTCLNKITHDIEGIAGAKTMFKGCGVS